MQRVWIGRVCVFFFFVENVFLLRRLFSFFAIAGATHPSTRKGTKKMQAALSARPALVRWLGHYH